ncbi:hypothetical protein [uncultured Gimesia sp.]|uniref:hypothetical protein n=1 Tax=uncultured Gimesia sp. TaxID=1678688 RepID=UPI0030DC26CA
MKYSTLLTMATCFLMGCGTADDGHQSISGQVTWNGEPISDGKISLMTAAGVTDAGDITNGVFTLRTTPGEKKVIVTAEKPAGFSRQEERVPEPEPVFYQYIPANYNTKTELKEQVEATTETLTFNLEGKEIKPPKK